MGGTAVATQGVTLTLTLALALTLTLTLTLTPTLTLTLTLIQGVTPEALGGGDDYRCKWSGASGSAIVPAQLSDEGRVTCVTPNMSAALPAVAADALPGTYALSVLSLIHI